LSPRALVIGVVGVILSLVLIIELVRRRKLRTGYSLLWLFIGFVLLILVISEDLVLFLTQLLGIQLPRSLLFTAGIVFCLLLLLEHSLTLSTLWRQNKDQAQEQALLEWRIRQLQARLEEADSAESAPPESASQPSLEGHDA
jgi:hypothetical protein